MFNLKISNIMRKLKLFFACLLMAVLSIGQVWADATFISANEAATSAKNGISLSVTSGSLASGDYYRIDKGATLTISSTSGNIESIVFTCTSSTYAKLASHSPEGTYSENNATVSWSGSASEVTFTAKTGSSNKNFRFSQVVITTAAGEDPTVSATPEAVTNVAAEGVTDQTINLTYENITDYETEVSVHPNADGTGTLSPAWLTASVSDADDYATITYSVSANDGAARTAYIKVYTLGEEGDAETIIPVSQAKYVAPFTGEILEITKDNFASGSYAANDDGITVEGFDFAVKDMYKNSNIIQAKASSGYIYNESVFGEIVKIEITKSGASNNNFTVYEGTSENPLTNSVSGEVEGTTTTYEFSEDQTYFTLKNGSTYSTVNPIKIYYYPVESAVTIDDAIENGSVGVTGAADLTQVAVGTELTLTNTPDASYKLEAYDVYKTGDATTKITITDGKFIMPAYAVTVSGSFELARDLTSIAISAEASKKTYLVGETFSSEGLEITASFSNAADAVVTPTSISSPDMSTAGVKTITISYTEGANTETTSYDITVKDAYTVTEILPLVPALNAGSLATRVKGYISQIDQYNSTYNSITYWISADGKTTSDQLEVYSGKNVGNTNFSSINDLEVGDFVTISGDVKTHTNGVKEFDKNNYIITGGRIQKGAVTTVTVSGTATKTAYSANETFETGGLVVTVTYANGFSCAVTEGITWGDDLTDHKVATSGDVAVTATVGGVTSDPYNVAIEVSTKTVSSIAVGTGAYTIYTGEALPEPTVTATYSEGDPADVSAEATYDSENVFDTETPGEQTITVSYTFGTNTVTTTYTVTVVDYANDAAHPYTPEQARYITINAVGSTKATKDIYVQGIVSRANAVTGTNKRQRYWISIDGETTSTEFEVYNGKYLAGADFSTTNQLVAGDEVIVKGKVIYYNSTTPEFATGESQLESLARTPNFEINNVASFEVGTDDLAVADLTITQDGEGEVTLASSDHPEYVSIVDGKLHAVAAGDATITANLAANGIYKAATAEFNVTVIPATIKYSITFNGNGADGGEAPEFDNEAAAGANLTLPANTYTKTGYIFTGWKVYDENQDEVTVTAGAFEMPASDVTIKAQWEEISEWAYVYTSNVTLSENSDNKCYAEGVTISTVDYDGLRIATGKAEGSATITVPAHTTKLHFHVAGWKDVNGSIYVKLGESTLATISLIADDGINQANNNTAPYALENDPIGYYSSVDIPDSESPTDIVFEAPSGKRAVIFGVNQVGGVLPVLDHITITGTMTNTTGWKTGDNIVPEGLTVNAIYTLNNVEQTPVEVDPNDVVWSHAALVENQTEVTLTATYEGKNANKVVTIGAVETGDPTIITDPTTYLNFGSSVEKDAVVASKTITVTLKNITSATATLGGETGDDYSAFSIDDTEIVDGDVITVSVNTGTVGVYAGTVTIKDDNSETQKVITLSMTVVEPEVSETAVATDSKWVPAEAADIKDGAVVLITGVKDDVTYAIGVQNDNNRAAVAGTLDKGVFTPGENTMAFTLVAQEGGTFALRASNGEYLYAASSSKNYLKRQATIDDNARWTLTATSAVANGTNTHKDMKFNGTNSPKIFSCYGSPNTQTAIQFYVPYVAPVAQIGETTYTTLDAAVAAANANDVVKLLANVDVTADGLTIGTNMTLDLNSFNIKAGEQLTNDINVPAGVKLTLVDNSANAKGKIYTEEAYTGSVNGYGVIRVAGEFLMQSGNIYAVIESDPANKGQFAVVIAAGGKVTVDGGQIKAGWYAISNNGNNTGSTIIVSGGELISTADFAIYNPAKESTVTVSGGVVYGAAGGIAMNRGELTVTGGTITSKDQGSTGTWGDGTGGLSNAAISASGKYESVSVEISGGTVVAEGNAIMITNGTTNPVEVAISGGQFSHVVPAEYCAEGFAPVTTPNAQGKYEVEVAPFVQVRNGLQEGWYYTMCMEKAVSAVHGGTIWRVLSKAENGTDVILEEVTGILEAGRPYIFNASAETLEVQYHGNEVQNPVTTGNNGLVGSFTKKEITQSSDNYILYNNQLYYVNSDNVYVGAHRAYLDMTGVPAYNSEPQQGNAPGRRVTMTVHGEQTATGMDALNASETPVKVLRDGQIFILRGEKMYNVNGQIVK